MAASIGVEEVAFCASTYKRPGQLVAAGETFCCQVEYLDQVGRAFGEGACEGQDGEIWGRSWMLVATRNASPFRSTTTKFLETSNAPPQP